MVKQANMIRFPVRVPDELNEWLKRESVRTGIPKSTLIYLAIDEYREKKEGLQNLPQMVELLDQLRSSGQLKSISQLKNKSK